ncbi:MAG: hypothetical protein ACD_75C02179G0001 [uncultured bacterium]|nr:MAG: hypothetical protein ACD_75C02179G0001 [uncultured bacterium]
MHQAVGAREDFDKGTKIFDGLYLALVNCPDHGFSGNGLHLGDEGLGKITAQGKHFHQPGVVYLDLCIEFRRQFLDNLSARADQIANLIRIDFNDHELRCMFGYLGTGNSNTLLHFRQDVHPAFLGLGKSLAHDLPVNAGDLDVHLQRGDAGTCTYHLEVHIAEMIFVTEDVGENDHLFPFLDQSHGNTGNRALQRHPGIHHGHAPAAYRGHRG